MLRCRLYYSLSDLKQFVDRLRQLITHNVYVGVHIYHYNGLQQCL